MKQFTKTTAYSLRTRLAFSYLLVILGTILVLSITISVVVQNYYAQLQSERLTALAEDVQQYAHSLYSQGEPLNASILRAFPNDLLLMTDTTNTPFCSYRYISPDNCNNPTVLQVLHQALGGNFSQQNTINITTRKDQVIPSQYICQSIEVNGKVIGAFFLSEPQISPDTNIMSLINRSILITGLIVAAVAAIISYLVARGLTRPLDRLITAATKMKQGEYAQRVELPTSLDEIGRLGQTFNEMAGTIEADINELRRQDQMRRELIANIAHDLATPLTAIQGYSEAIADDVITEPTARHETAQLIGREVQRLRRLVGDVRQMTSMEAGQTKLDLAPLDMHALVDETAAVIEPECAESEISLYNEISPKIAPILADSDRITQVLLNLLDNARRHTPRGGKITVGAQAEKTMLHLWISDTGSGIDPADLPHIFERFYRADRSRTTTTGGSGLGLSIVKAIITAHGGKVWAESTIGKGTRIHFTLPLVNQPATLTPAPIATPR
ncbi:sensor histidine kinase [Tengunoibacter tsumagoiensis]|uniref:histidine kinase n=1 Tax=Tengunoibacter tsumagoiensis TaxID=2014871 RepID=A0A401ZW42_9CHLR|nr:HAMP domain-containing sensor histidine kinase [Tengunoibacter tsumagoiensis]GCE11108.1 hypothetical protein KTT_09670 [Tengunoibacter tsumagoiensis]